MYASFALFLWMPVAKTVNPACLRLSHKRERQQHDGSCSAEGSGKTQCRCLAAFYAFKKTRGQRRPGRRRGHMQHVQNGGEILRKCQKCLKSLNEASSRYFFCKKAVQNIPLKKMFALKLPSNFLCSLNND